MQYEAPELIAINAADSIQQTILGKSPLYPLTEGVRPQQKNEMSVGYADWE